MSGFQVVTEATLRDIVREEEALGAVEAAFRALAEGRVRQPAPLGLEIPESRGEVHVKGAHLQGEPVFAIKVASGFYDNPGHGLPTGSGLVLVFDAATGFPLALLQDNGYLTEMRTGAAGALATRLLAPASLERVAVLGTGVQARYQVRAIAGVRRWTETVAWSPTPEHVAAYCREMEAAMDVPFRGAASAQAAVEGADLVISVTPARQPILHGAWLAPHATVVAVGSDGPGKQELAVDVLARADRVVADHRDQCLRLGEVHHAAAAGVLAPESVDELGAVVTGQRPGREGNELIVCDLTGVGAQDAAMAAAAWKRIGAGNGLGSAQTGV
jgi:ornithine cyclodeaminase